MQEKKFWTLVALAGLTAVTLVRPERDLDGRPASRPFRTPLTKDGIASGSLSVAGSSSPGASPHPDSSPWLLFRADWSAVLWRVYKKMNDNRLLAVAAGVVFYGLLAVFPAITAFVSLYGLLADPATIHERLSLATGILPQGALNILNEQLTRLTSHRTSALSVGFIGGLIVALWSANAGAKAVMDALNVAYGETEKRSFIHLNLVALAFTLGTIFALMLALGAVVVAPIVLSRLGLSGVNETLVALARWPILLGARSLGVDNSLSLRSQLDRPALDVALPRQCHCRSKLAGALRAIFLVHLQFRKLRRHLWLAGRGDRHDDLDVDFHDRRASWSRIERRYPAPNKL